MEYNLIKPKILIVDDREENLYALRKILTELDCEIVSCNSGNDALAVILEERFALLLVDAQMPEMDGFETVSLLKQDPSNYDLPVIFISAIYQSEEYYVRAIRSGAVDFITKPVNPEILLGKVKVFLELYNSKMQIKHSVAMNRAIINSTNHFCNYSIDKNYKLISFNRNYKKSIKRYYDLDVQIGMNVLQFSDKPNLVKNYYNRILAGRTIAGEKEIKDQNGRLSHFDVNGSPITTEEGNIVGLTVFLTDITEKKQIENEKEELIEKLQKALDDVKTLRGLIPICAHCKKIRTDEGPWQQLEEYIKNNSNASFSHGLCPDCAHKLYPDYYKDEKK